MTQQRSDGEGDLISRPSTPSEGQTGSNRGVPAVCKTVPRFRCDIHNKDCFSSRKCSFFLFSMAIGVEAFSLNVADHGHRRDEHEDAEQDDQYRASVEPAY